VVAQNTVDKYKNSWFERRTGRQASLAEQSEMFHCETFTATLNGREFGRSGAIG
jgi:hypothetical protein